MGVVDLGGLWVLEGVFVLEILFWWDLVIFGIEVECCCFFCLVDGFDFMILVKWLGCLFYVL